MTSIGLLLGMAAAKRGTLDAAVAKMLSIHVPALLPATSAEIGVPQSKLFLHAASLSRGLLGEKKEEKKRK